MPTIVEDSTLITVPEDDPNEKFRRLVATLTQIDRHVDPEGAARLISDKVSGYGLKGLPAAIEYLESAFPGTLKPGLTPHRVAPPKRLADMTPEEKLADVTLFFGPGSSSLEANRLALHNNAEYQRLRKTAVAQGLLAK